MPKKVFPLMLTVLLVSATFLSLFHIQPVKATGTIYIRADGSIEPSNAPIQRNGEVYSLTGNITVTDYKDGLIVERTGIELVGNGFTISGWGSSPEHGAKGITVTNVDSVTLRDLQIEQFLFGIYLNCSDHNTINRINSTRLTMFNSSKSVILQSSFRPADIMTEPDICLENSHNNTLFKNRILYGGTTGILLRNSERNNLTENDLSGSGSPRQSAVGIYLSNSSETIIFNNTVTDPRASGWYVSGIAIRDSSDILIEQCDIINVSYCLGMVDSSNCNINRNSILRSSIVAYTGGCIGFNNCSGNNIRENNIVGGTHPSKGVLIPNSMNNTFMNNSITGNSDEGTYFENCSNNVIEGNHIIGNRVGVGLVSSSDNSFSRNAFANQIEVTTQNSTNKWDADYPKGGNYWNGSVALDEKSGPTQDEDGGDGIIDLPHSIDADNIDRYPLMFAKPAFAYFPTDPVAQQITVFFDASESVGLTEPISKYCWDFGDAIEDEGEFVNHTYNAYGTYGSTLTIVLNSGMMCNLTKNVTVRQVPFADFVFIPSSEISFLQPILFDSSSSSPLGGNIAAYDWNFGDGNNTQTDSPHIIHPYDTFGVYNVSLTVLDSEALNSSCSKQVITKMPTSVSVSTTSSTNQVGFRVNIGGRLTDFFGVGLASRNVVVSYTFSGAQSWFPITSSMTDATGQYSTQWIPTAAGNFIIRAEWTGNFSHFSAKQNITLSILPVESQYVFAVESNSTVSDLTFDTASRRLSFSVSGEDGTVGYTRVTVAKSLIADIVKLKIRLDGVEYNYTATDADSSWVLMFMYSHSIHQVEVDLEAGMRTSDINGDGQVDMRDIGYVARRFMCIPGDPLWDSATDLNGDGNINMVDIGAVASHYGQRYV